VFREGGRAEAFNFTVPYPEPFVPKALTFEVPERIMVDGTVARSLDESAVIAVLERLKAAGVEAIAVCLLWSIVNPTHELAVGRIIESHLPGIPFTLSHQVNPSIREYRRAMSTVIDASLKPVVGAYMSGLEIRLRQAGFAGRVLIVTSHGGVTDTATAAASPVQLINSGPSMGPVGALAYGRSVSTDTLIVGDTGGTTFDVSLVRDGRIPRTRETWLGRPLVSHLTGMPSVDVRSIGAGGGSIAWVDKGGLLHVGPASAGALPGPAAYGHGGARPTVTDAALMLGFIDADYFLGGRMTLDRKAAERAIEREVAELLGLSLEEAAAAIIELATENIVQAIMDITVNQGIDPARAAFIAGGGAAGLNCVAIGRRLGCNKVLVPETGAALAAVGALISDLTARFHAMLHSHSSNFDRRGVNEVLTRLKVDCIAFAERTTGGRDASISWSTEARYPDQAWEIEVPLTGSSFDSIEAVKELIEDFHRAHQNLFAVHDPHSPIETIGWNAEVHCKVGPHEPGRLNSKNAPVRLPPRKVRFLAGGWQTIEVHHFDALPEHAKVIGPAIVESSFTSIVIDPGARAVRDQFGSLVIDVGT
jgi:N-methylhydantoinase A